MKKMDEVTREKDTKKLYTDIVDMISDYLYKYHEVYENANMSDVQAYLHVLGGLSASIIASKVPNEDWESTLKGVDNNMRKGLLDV